MRQAAVVRAEAREKDREADHRNLNAGYDRPEVRCNRCGRLSRADLRKVRRPGDTALQQPGGRAVLPGMLAVEEMETARAYCRAGV
jgi:hypothetical protein